MMFVSKTVQGKCERKEKSVLLRTQKMLPFNSSKGRCFISGDVSQRIKERKKKKESLYSQSESIRFLMIGKICFLNVINCFVVLPLHYSELDQVGLRTCVN